MVRTDVTGGAVDVKVDAVSRLDRRNGSALVRHVRSIAVRHHQHVVLDLTDVGAIDPDGLDAVVQAAAALESRGATVAVEPWWAADAVALTGWLGGR